MKVMKLPTKQTQTMTALEVEIITEMEKGETKVCFLSIIVEV